jgi:hypothetical protein
MLGGVLSLLLFNIYLDEALKSSPELVKLIKKGRLLAFADDVLVMAESKEELEMELN